MIYFNPIPQRLSVHYTHYTIAKLHLPDASIAKPKYKPIYANMNMLTAITCLVLIPIPIMYPSIDTVQDVRYRRL